MMLPRYTITLANYYQKDDPSISLVRSTIAVVEIPSDTVVSNQEYWHNPKLVPDTTETLSELERLITQTLEISNHYANCDPSSVKVVVLNEPFILSKDKEEYTTIITITEDLLKSGLGTIKNLTRKIGRNDPCQCGSSKKFKKCCLGKANGQLKIQYVD